MITNEVARLVCSRLPKFESTWKGKHYTGESSVWCTDSGIRRLYVNGKYGKIGFVNLEKDEYEVKKVVSKKDPAGNGGWCQDRTLENQRKLKKILEVCLKIGGVE